MEPRIDGTEFGSITVEGERYEMDIVIEPEGEVRKRKKKLSKALYGTSHIMSKDEARDVYREGSEQLIVGSGQDDQLRLSDEAAKYFRKRECKVTLLPTPEAVEAWNQARGKVVGLFHVTC